MCRPAVNIRYYSPGPAHLIFWDKASLNGAWWPLMNLGWLASKPQGCLPPMLGLQACHSSRLFTRPLGIEVGGFYWLSQEADLWFVKSSRFSSAACSTRWAAQFNCFKRKRSLEILYLVSQWRKLIWSVSSFMSFELFWGPKFAVLADGAILSN